MTAKRDLVYVPIESLTERYTEQWRRNFPIEFEKAGWNVIVIDGKPLVEDDIKVGAFLDVNSTCHYKFSQLQQLSKLFNDGLVAQGTTFFFGDVEFWGIESVRLMARMNNVQVNLTGFLHAGSYTKGDAFEVAADFQQYTEVGWIASLDKVFVGSEYHKRAFTERRLLPLNALHLADRIVVTKNPIFADEYHQFDLPKEKRVLLTNRTDSEKDVTSTLELFAHLQPKFPDWKFVVTTSRKTLRSNDPRITEYARRLQATGVIEILEGLSKEQYHRELARSSIMVSHSPEENYGYCIAEALHYKVIPILKAGCSHPEFVPWYLLFDSNEVAKSELSWMLSEWDDTPPDCPKLDCSGMQNIINELKHL